MLDDKKRAKIDQSTAEGGEVLPAMWHSVYVGCIAQGFTAEQSFALVQTFILTSCSGGVNLPDANVDSEDDDK